MTQEKNKNNDAITDLIEAQKAMGKVFKTSINPHFKSAYANLENVLSVCLAAFHKHNFAFIQPSCRDEFGDYIETKLIHKSGKEFTSKIYVVMDRQNMQGLGSAITYARRYGALQMAGLAPEDDDGNEASKQIRKIPPVKSIIKENF